MVTFDKFQSAIKLLAKEVGGDLNLEQIHMIIELMANYPKPLSFGELAEIVGTHMGKIKTNRKILGEHLVQSTTTKDWKDIGLGLIEVQPDPYEPEKETMVLTKKGMALKAMLLEALS
jgi:DNA-binding HxlR family transcriptional regulator